MSQNATSKTENVQFISLVTTRLHACMRKGSLTVDALRCVALTCGNAPRHGLSQSTAVYVKFQFSTSVCAHATSLYDTEYQQDEQH